MNLTTESMQNDDSSSRLGAAPYIPTEPVSQSNGTVEFSSDEIVIHNDVSKHSIELKNNKNNFNDKRKSYKTNRRQTEELIANDRHGAIEAESQPRQRSSSFIGDKAQNLRSMVAGLESKLENKAVTLVSMFNAKRSESPALEETVEKKEMKVKFRRQEKELETTDDEKEYSRMSARTPEGKSRHSQLDKIVSPTVINRVPGRKATIRSIDPEMKQHTRNEQVEKVEEKAKETKTQKEKGAVNSIAGRISPKLNSTARSLISMFESKQSTSSPLTPHNEYWQYTGKMKK